jgi:predicted secreted protein
MKLFEKKPTVIKSVLQEITTRMNNKLNIINEKLSDGRSKKVIFLSHCILNENTRYQGGAFCAGINTAVLSALMKSNYGIIQLPCPEQLAWGGILRKMIWLPLGSKGKPVAAFFKLLFPFFIAYTKWKYARLASTTAAQIKAYADAGYEIAGLMGIDGSPTCGVSNTVDMKKSFHYIAALTTDSLNRSAYNNNLYRICKINGRGLFINILSQKLEKMGININFSSISIEEEMKKNQL